MKIRSIHWLLIGLVFLTSARAQVIVTGGADASTLAELSSVPDFGVFWSATGQMPPSPFDPLPQLHVYHYGPAGDDQYIYDDRNVDYAALMQQDTIGAETEQVSSAGTAVKKPSGFDPMFGFQNGVPALSLTVTGSNATLKWPSASGELFLVEAETNLASGVAPIGIPWTIVTNPLLAATGSQTTFVDPNPVIYPTVTNGSGGGGGGTNGPPPPGGGSTNSGSGGLNSSTARFYTVYNVTPTAGQPVFSVAENSSANQLNIFQNAFDPNGTYFYVYSLTQPHHGSITYSADGSTFQYTPNTGFYGVDTFPFTIENSYGGLSSSTASICVTESGDAALSVNNLILVLPTNIYTIAFNAITNSSSPSSKLLAVSTPLFGSVATNSSGNVTYTRIGSLYGTDSFSYVVTDGNGGYASGTVQVQQVSTANNGLPDQWQLAYGMNPSLDNSLADPDGDGVPNIVEFMLGADPLVPDSPLNLPTIPSGTVLGGFAQLPLVGISAFVPTPPVVLYVNGAPAAGASVSQGPDGMWSLNWDTTHLSNGVYNIETALQYGNSTAGPQYQLFGTQKTITVSNLLTFDSLTSQFTDYGLIVYATSSHQNISYSIYLYDDYGNPLVSVSGSTTDGIINPGLWNLEYAPNEYYDSGNIQALFVLSGPGIPSGTQITQWWYREGSAGNPGFVAAWGWDSYLPGFLTYEDNMIMGGVVNVLANPNANNPYTMAPCCVWNQWDSPSSMFRYDSDSDKQTLTNALAQNLYFFWLGHGGSSVICGNPEHSNIGPVDVEDALGNYFMRSTPKHPQTNAHPYKLVVLDGCQTDSPQWAQAFGITYDQIGTTNFVAGYEGTGRVPRAFVGWSKTNEAPGTADVFLGGTIHAEFESALSELWGSWMSGFPLNVCLSSFAYTATNYGFVGQDSWHISGCVDLQKGE